MSSSGIFGYINYLVEKDRKFILDTLLNGELHLIPAPRWCANSPIIPANESTTTTTASLSPLDCPVVLTVSSRTISPRVPWL